jgi:hypothetical protein
MDIIDVLLEDHAALRGELAVLTAPFTGPPGTGRLALDNRGLLRDVRGFFNLFKAHEAVEDDFFSEAFCMVDLDPAQRAEFTEGRRSLAESIKLFGSIAFSCDGENVHPMRVISARLKVDMHAHLVFEELVIFPKARKRLPASRLRDLEKLARMETRRKIVRAGLKRTPIAG